MIEHVGAIPDKPLSQAVRAGDWIYISGQAATDPHSGAFVAGTFDEEFARSVANLRAVVEAAGARMDQIVRIGAYVRDETDLPRYNELYLDAFAHPRPARTTMATGLEFLRFELDAVVYVGT